MENAEPSLAVGYFLFGDTLDGTAFICVLQLVYLFIQPFNADFLFHFFENRIGKRSGNCEK